MIGARLLSAWDQIVESTALLAVIILSLCVMVGAVKPADTPRRLGLIAGVMILLIMLPAIIMGSWNLMSFEQRLGITVIVVVMLVLLLGARGKSKRTMASRR